MGLKVIVGLSYYGESPKSLYSKDIGYGEKSWMECLLVLLMLL